MGAKTAISADITRSGFVLNGAPYLPRFLLICRAQRSMHQHGRGGFWYFLFSFLLLVEHAMNRITSHFSNLHNLEMKCYYARSGACNDNQSA
jgi:hypothetical protein